MTVLPRTITITIDPATLNAVRADAKKNFEPAATMAAIRLRELYAASVGEVAMTEDAKLRLRRVELQNEAMERKAQIESRELVRKDSVVGFIEKKYAITRQQILQIPWTIPGGTPEQIAALNEQVQDCMTTLSGAAAWDDTGD